MTFSTNQSISLKWIRLLRHQSTNPAIRVYTATNNYVYQLQPIFNCSYTSLFAKPYLTYSGRRANSNIPNLLDTAPISQSCIKLHVKSVIINSYFIDINCRFVIISLETSIMISETFLS